MNQIAALTPQQLRQAADLKERILGLQQEIAELLGAPVEPEATIKPEAPARSATKKRKLSPAARRRLSALAKARWAGVKAAGRTRL
jgi:hypothetical protein